MTEKNSESFPTQAQVVIIGGGVIGCAIAPVLGGWLHDVFGWRSVFWFLVAYGAALAAAALDGGPSPLLAADSPLQGMFPVRLVLREVTARCIPPGATRAPPGRAN